MDDPVYNETVKNEFLSLYPENTQTTYKRIFINSQEIEDRLGKDLAEFNVAEVIEVLQKLNPSTPAASRTNGRIISAYWDWALIKKYRKTNGNPFKKKSQAWFDQFAKGQKLYLTEKELRSIEDFCDNYQDLICFRLPYEGVLGMECAEICNLKAEDVDFVNNTLHLTDYDGSQRDLEVSDRCIQAIRGALKEREYKKRNGEIDDPNGNIGEYAELVQNNYVIRNAITRTINFESVSRHTIYRRIDTIRELYSEDYPHLTATNISRSGMIKMAKDLLEQYGELGKEQLQAIADRYKVNNTQYLHDFINVETIKELYGDK